MQPLDVARGKPLDCARGKAISLCAIAVACVGLIVSTFAQSGANDGWSSKAPLGVLRTEVGSAFAAGKLYVGAGGLAMAESSTLVQEYDPKTDR